VQSLLIDGEVDEGLGRSRKARATVMAASISELGQSMFPAASKWPEHAAFDGTDSIGAPRIVGNGLSELALNRGLRVAAVDDFFVEGLVCVHVFREEHDDSCGETVAQGVHAGAGFTFRGRRIAGLFEIYARDL
jgi:hypothetical protein